MAPRERLAAPTAGRTAAPIIRRGATPTPTPTPAARKAVAKEPAAPVAVAKTYTLRQLATETGEALDYTPKDTIAIATDFINRIVMEVKDGNSIRLDGLGTLTLKDRAERQGRNPSTGEAITIAASRVVTFKMDRGLKRSLAEE